MYTQFRKSVLAAGITVALATIGGTAAADSIAQDITDARQETQIWTTYALSPYLRANDLKVSVNNGKATLTGKVEEDVNKDLAKKIALGVSGIEAVDNQIIVQADYVPPPREATRSYGDMIDDANITAAVKSKLMWSKSVSGLTADVDTTSGKVTLLGSADSAESRALAGRLALNTRGVKSVDNQLEVSNAKPVGSASGKDLTREAGHEIADGWISTKVKSTFMYSSNVDSSDIAVRTDNGIVTLSGKVDSGAEHALAIELANSVRGVKSVQSTGLTF